MIIRISACAHVRELRELGVRGREERGDEAVLIVGRCEGHGVAAQRQGGELGHAGAVEHLHHLVAEFPVLPFWGLIGT